MRSEKDWRGRLLCCDLDDDVLSCERTKNGCASVLSRNFGIGIHGRFKIQDLFLSTEDVQRELLSFCPFNPCIDHRGPLIR